MQMIVHGFPSRLVRNQAHLILLNLTKKKKSLLCSSNGHGKILTNPGIFAIRTGVSLEIVERDVSTNSSSKNNNVFSIQILIRELCRIVRTMITRPPFNNWPLHVKLFTTEAVKLWDTASAAKHAPAMPPGFTSSIELEGVDGKSGHSGRKGAIAVDDGSKASFIFLL
jgi:hypothetical protein